MACFMGEVGHMSEIDNQVQVQSQVWDFDFVESQTLSTWVIDITQ